MQPDRTPIIVGGTGLYLMALTDGLSDIPAIPDQHRDKARAMVEADQAGARALLLEKDPATADRIEANDRQRTSRALEVLLRNRQAALAASTGRARQFCRRGAWAGVTLTPPRETLYARINARVDAMMRANALDEARTLWQRRLDQRFPPCAPTACRASATISKAASRSPTQSTAASATPAATPSAR